MKKFGDGRDWFFETKFGLFIHWGLYAIPAWHEQLQWRKRVPRADYVPYADEFNPTKFDPHAWLDLAEEVGMEYICFTTKHHDGYCLWDTDQTDFNVMNSPYGKDILRELADACHERNFPLCLYYSVVDWHQPNYPNQGRTHELPEPEKGDEPDMAKYKEFVCAQVRELCTNYGPIKCFWWDMNVTEDVDPSINGLIRELQPGIVINNRGFDDGDFGTPEREWDSSVDEKPMFEAPTEGCQSVGVESWGWREDEDYYTDRFLIQSFDKFLAKGGKYLLNIGPHADGTLPDVAVQMVRVVGDWYARVREAFEDTVPASHVIGNPDVLTTQRNNTLYVHLYKPPIKTGIYLYPLTQQPRSATLLNTGRPVEARTDMVPFFHSTQDCFLWLHDLPANELSDTVMVVKLEFDELNLSEASC